MTPELMIRWSDPRINDPMVRLGLQLLSGPVEPPGSSRFLTQKRRRQLEAFTFAQMWEEPGTSGPTAELAQSSDPDGNSEHYSPVCTLNTHFRLGEREREAMEAETCVRNLEDQERECVYSPAVCVCVLKSDPAAGLDD